MRKILSKLNDVLSLYLGLKNFTINPQLLSKKGGNLKLLYTESFKRCPLQIDLSKMDFQALNKDKRDQLGTAAGKLIARNLIISFESITINRETHA